MLPPPSGGSSSLKTPLSQSPVGTGTVPSLEGHMTTHLSAPAAAAHPGDLLGEKMQHEEEQLHHQEERGCLLTSPLFAIQ